VCYRGLKDDSSLALEGWEWALRVLDERRVGVLEVKQGGETKSRHRPDVPASIGEVESERKTTRVIAPAPRENTQRFVSTEEISEWTSCLRYYLQW
jgi:hypothetical protein